ncbi:MAG: SURF1 family protein [Bdellovibrionales bacterium]
MTAVPTYKLPFSPAALAVAFAVVALLALSFWQFYRLGWKTELINTVAQRQQAAPVTTMNGPVEDLNFRRAILTGSINRSEGFELLTQTYEGQLGHDWIVPMVVPTGSGATGIVVLVDLGWVPDDWTPPPNGSANIETISGTLGIPPKRNFFTLANPPGLNKLYHLDPAEIAARLDAPVSPLVLYADRLGDAPPVGGQLILEFRNNHLVYALTWLALAIAAVVMYVVGTRRNVKFTIDP